MGLPTDGKQQKLPRKTIGSIPTLEFFGYKIPLCGDIPRRCDQHGQYVRHKTHLSGIQQDGTVELVTVKRIVVKCLTQRTDQPLPEPMKLEPHQGSLIPQAGDRVLGPGFSMDVVRRQFELEDGVLYVFLEDG